TALPAPPGPSGMLRVAYSAPMDWLAGLPQFALEFDSGERIWLPGPTRSRRRVVRGEIDRRAEVREAMAGLERHLESERQQRLAAEERSVELAEAHGQAVARIAELESELLLSQQQIQGRLAAAAEAREAAETNSAETQRLLEAQLAEVQRQLGDELAAQQLLAAELAETAQRADEAAGRAE